MNRGRERIVERDRRWVDRDHVGRAERTRKRVAYRGTVPHALGESERWGRIESTELTRSSTSEGFTIVEHWWRDARDMPLARKKKGGASGRGVRDEDRRPTAAPEVEVDDEASRNARRDAEASVCRRSMGAKVDEKCPQSTLRQGKGG